MSECLEPSLPELRVPGLGYKTDVVRGMSSQMLLLLPFPPGSSITGFS